MKCFNCGKETNEYLCLDCRTEEILDRIFEQIRYFKPEACTNVYLLEYASSLSEERGERKCIPDILDLFSAEVSAYYYCLYDWISSNEQFEKSAEEYLSKYAWAEKKSQVLISYLLKKYIRNDFVKPRAWCDWIMEADGVYCELYAHAATYFAMIAEYDLADHAVNKGLACNMFLYSTKEYMVSMLEKQKIDTLRYRTKKPYWPITEERRRAVAMFYDEKGIAYPRIEGKPHKVMEDAFEPIAECFELPESYCAFWCSAAFSIANAKPIYQIASVKVSNGCIGDTFQSYVRPWDGSAGRKAAAKEAGVPLAVIEGAEDVDQVMPKFFAFVGDNVLVSTGALGTQAKLISRAARYSGMKRISNEFFDLLDMAADTDSNFDLKNNNREFLLEYFSIVEGSSALDKAKANVLLCEALKNYEE